MYLQVALHLLTSSRLDSSWLLFASAHCGSRLGEHLYYARTTPDPLEVGRLMLFLLPEIARTSRPFCSIASRRVRSWEAWAPSSALHAGARARLVPGRAMRPRSSDGLRLIRRAGGRCKDLSWPVKVTCLFSPSRRRAMAAMRAVGGGTDARTRKIPGVEWFGFRGQT